jgi:nitroimidazol reductase NimA-like FMN-containing flavoprotein (pyridoxamine 5'-phosphate oxidase superfamily)
VDGNEPVAELNSRFSEEGATAVAWAEGRQRLEEAEIYWLSTVRPDGRPHVSPLLSVWLDEALYFCTGDDERKARNLARNPQCILTVGGGGLHEGLDVVVEGRAVRVDEEAVLQRIADAWEAKYGPAWHYEVRDGAAYVYRVAPVTAFGFGRGGYTQTRWRFPHE